MRLLLSDNDGSVLDIWDDDLDADTITRLYALLRGHAPGDFPLPADVVAALAAEGATS